MIQGNPLEGAALKLATYPLKEVQYAKEIMCEKNLTPSLLSYYTRSSYKPCEMKSKVINMLCTSGILHVADILKLEMQY